MKDSSKKYVKKITWLSSAFSVCADLSFLLLGGELKRKEKMSSRLGDILSKLYLSSACLKYYYDNGRSTSDWFTLEWILQTNLYQAQEAFYGFFDNFPHARMGWVLKRFIFPYGKVFSEPKDILSHHINKQILSSSEFRKRITHLCILEKI